MNILKKAIRILQRPHPFIFNRNSLWISFAITFFVIFIFRPFGFALESTSSLFIWALLFGFIAAGSVFLVVRLLQKYLAEMLSEERWTVGKEILLIFTVLFVIIMAVFGMFYILRPQQNFWGLLQLVFVRTVLIGIFPILILVLFEQSHHQRLKRKEAQKLNQDLHRRASQLHEKLSSVSEPKIILNADNQKMALQLEAKYLFFIRSAGNYVEVYYQQNQKIQKELVRNSLKDISEQLPEMPFFRCHNRFVVNLDHIQKAVGNARNLELVMENVEGYIPVSRSKSKELLQLLQSDHR